MRRILPFLALAGCLEYGVYPTDEVVLPGPPRPDPWELGVALAEGPDAPIPPDALPNMPPADLWPDGPPVPWDDWDDSWWEYPYQEPPSDEPAPFLDGRARMGGDGTVVAEWGTLRHAFMIHCAASFPVSSLDIDLGPYGAFALDRLDWAYCLDDPAIQGSQPEPAFNTVVGVALGDVDGEPARVWFRLVDAGEPGVNDHLHMAFTFGTHMLDVEGYLASGNHQVIAPVGGL